MKKCMVCDKELGKNYFVTEDGEVCSGKCFDVNYWGNILANKNKIIIDGGCYYIGNEDEEERYKGFEGKYFKIEKFTDEIIETTNLGFNDIIPDEYREEFQDNAKFLL